MIGRLPNFLHLGPGKAGSTWLHEVLVLHPDVYLSDAKDLYFFSRYYDRGTDWYRSQFRQAAPTAAIVGEVSPDYLASPPAPARIRETLGEDVQLMVTLRDPAERAFSAYLYLRKHGLAENTFRRTLDLTPMLLDEGRYATHLRRYLAHFDRSNIRVTVFDDLEEDPQAYLDATTDWLGVTRQAHSPEVLGKRLPASSARWLPAARLAQTGADWVRRHDGASVVGRVKRSALVQRVLYQPLGDSAPVIAPEDRAHIRGLLEPEVRDVEREFGVPLTERWGWR